MSAVATDTHALIWYTLRSPEISAGARAALRQAERDREAIYVSAITLVEIRYLVEKGTVTEAAFQELLDFLTDPATTAVVVPLDFDIALTVEQIPRNIVPDMPDRIIAATALHLGVPLVTRDAKIRAAPITTIW